MKRMFLAKSLACALALPSLFITPADAQDVVESGKTRVLQLPEQPFSYADRQLPAHFKQLSVRRFDNTPADNPVTDAGAALGRVLFYDTRLSVNNTIACASCHQQKHAFSDPARFSKGHDGKLTDRNSMPLVNVRFYPTGRFFWDERAATLEQQVLMPIQNKLEMGQDLGKLIDILGNDATYPGLYSKAFGDATVTKERTAKALAQFVRSWFPANRNTTRAWPRSERWATTFRISRPLKTGARRFSFATARFVIFPTARARFSRYCGHKTMAWMQQPECPTWAWPT